MFPTTRLRIIIITFILFSAGGPAAAVDTTPPLPRTTLAPSGPVVASANGQVIENLLITANGAVAVDFAGHSNVTLRNCYIRHANLGVKASGCLNPTVDHCAFVRTPVPARGTGNSEADGVQYNGCSGAMTVSNCEFWNTSVGVYLVNNASGAHLFNINAFNMMGPLPRGQLAQANNSPGVLIEDFYNYNDLAVAWTEDNLNFYDSNNATVRRGCIDGNNSPSGVGVIFDGTHNDIVGGQVTDVDALHQGNGAFSAYSATNITFTRCRTRDGHAGGVGGRAAASSNGLSFHSFDGSSGTRFVDCVYRNPANPNNIVWDVSTCTTVDITEQDFVPRGRIVLSGMPYASAAANRAPVASAQSVTATEDTAKAIILAATDADGDALTYAIVAAPAHGTVSGSGTARTYTPAANYSGADSFTFKAHDGTVDSNTATVAITVGAANDAPTIQAIAAQNAVKGVATTVPFTIADVETAAAALVVTATSANAAVVPASGLVLGGSGANRTLGVTPSAGGSASITVTVQDGGGLTASRTFTLSVTAPPAFSAQPSGRTATAGATATFSALATGTPAPTYQWQKNGVNIAGATAASYTTPTITAADHGATFRAVASNSAGSATSNGATLTVTATTGGWQASYYDNDDFTGTRVQRTDAAIDFAWADGIPVPTIAADTFSVRWRARLTAPTSGTWTFLATTDDGVRMWVGGTLVIDQWTNRSASESSAQVPLVAGQAVEVVMEYFDNASTAVAKLEWQGPGQARQVIPPSVTAPAAGDDLPGGWLRSDLGTVTVVGTASESAGTWTVSGAGTDIWNKADSGSFLSQAVSGDLSITARITAVSDTDAWAKAGVMVRETTTTGSRHTFTCVTPDNGVAFQRRRIAGGTSAHTAGSTSSAPYWVRVERIGNVLVGSCSADGTTWTQIRRVTIAMNPSVRVGLAVTAHASGAACTATFTDVSLIAASTTSN